MRLINYFRHKIRALWLKLAEIFTTNTSRKVISVLIAIVVWILTVNISNPEVTVEHNLSIDVNYSDALEDANKTYTLSTSTARVSYTIRSDNRRYVSASDFTAYVNLIDYSITGSVPVYVDVDPQVSSYVSNISVRPIVIRVETEDMVERTFDINVSIDGSAADGKAIGDLEMDTDTLTLYGPSSDIGRVASVGINIAVNAADSDISGVAEPVYYDSVGNEITLDARTTARETLSYTLHIYNTRRYAILASYSGTPAYGYSVSSITCDPVSLVVYGPDSILSAYSTITIPDSVVDVTGSRRNVAVLVDVSQYLPEGLSLTDSGEVSIVANIVRTSTLPSTQAPTTATEETLADSSSESVSGTVEEIVHTTESTESSGEALETSPETTESTTHNVAEATESATHSTESSGVSQSEESSPGESGPGQSSTSDTTGEG